jgi:hypothetical protein
MGFFDLFKLYPDLSELESCMGVENSGEEIQTEFSFTVAAPYSSSPKHAKEHGFEHMATGRNWWPTHLYEWREMKFYWRKAKEFKEIEIPKNRASWYRRNDFQWNYIKIPQFASDIQASGCGFKVVNNAITPARLMGYFTLVRMTTKPLQKHLNLFERLGYRKLDEGKIAEYWINGMEPDKHTMAGEVKPILENLKLYKPKHIPIAALSKDKKFIDKDNF